MIIDKMNYGGDVPLKVRTENTEKGYRVIFEIESKNEGIEFHDRVAIRICQGPHDFLGHIFRKNHDRFKVNKTYEI
jgi:hypothetical protein